MITILLKVFTIFCGSGLKWIGPFIIPFINILALISCFIPISLSIYLSSNNYLNSSDDKKTAGRSFGFGFLIYYVIMFLIGCSVLQISCAANDQISF
jgi:apolipoprotein N-acyltransferase